MAKIKKKLSFLSYVSLRTYQKTCLFKILILCLMLYRVYKGSEIVFFVFFISFILRLEQFFSIVKNIYNVRSVKKKFVRTILNQIFISFNDLSHSSIFFLSERHHRSRKISFVFENFVLSLKLYPSLCNRILIYW